MRIAVLGVGLVGGSVALGVRAAAPDVDVVGYDPDEGARGAALERGAVTRWAPSPHEAVRGADVVAAVTHSPEPVVRRDWLAPGTHVTSVGVHAHGREVDGETVRDALVVVESRAAALAPFPGGSNDLRWPIRDGLIAEGHIYAELAELVTGHKVGRRDDHQLTLYKSVGVAVQDAAATALVLRRATDAPTVSL